MTFTRKYNSIPPFFWMILSIIYLWVSLILVLWIVENIIELIRTGTTALSLVDHINQVGFMSLWLGAYIIFFGTYAVINNGVTEMTISPQEQEVRFVYHSILTLYIKEKTLTIPYHELYYTIGKVKHPKLVRALNPLFPPVVFTLYKKNRDLFRFRFGCSIGWTARQFETIERLLKDITPPLDL